MRPDDFYVHYDDMGLEDLEPAFNDELILALRRGPVEGYEDLEVATGLTRLIHDELEKFGTSSEHKLSEPQIRDAILALTAMAKRVGVSDFKLPFRDFGTFRSYWLRNDGHGSWQARRDMLNTLLDPLHDRLIDLENRQLSSTLAKAITPHSATGWARVDAEILELHRHFRIARSEQDHRNVGNDCVAILEALSRQVYDPGIHLRKGEQEPPIDRTKIRIERYIEDALPNAGDAELRKLVRAAIEFSHSIKHSETPTRRDAGVAADAVILLANLLRRLAEPIER